MTSFVCHHEVRDLSLKGDTMPNKPIPQEVTVDPKTTAFLVLDLNCRCEDPKEPCYKLINPVAQFLERARQANMFICTPPPTATRARRKRECPRHLNSATMNRQFFHLH